jgi:hypothetical protein
LCILVFLSWRRLTFAGGHGTLLGVINSVVHIVMYSYYLLAALGPQWQKYLWWKKYITTMQLVRVDNNESHRNKNTKNKELVCGATFLFLQTVNYVKMLAQILN